MEKMFSLVRCLGSLRSRDFPLSMYITTFKVHELYVLSPSAGKCV